MAKKTAVVAAVIAIQWFQINPKAVSILRYLIERQTMEWCSTVWFTSDFVIRISKLTILFIKQTSVLKYLPFEYRTSPIFKSPLCYHFRLHLSLIWVVKTFRFSPVLVTQTLKDIFPRWDRLTGKFCQQIQIVSKKRISPLNKWLFNETFRIF